MRHTYEITRDCQYGGRRYTKGQRLQDAWVGPALELRGDARKVKPKRKRKTTSKEGSSSKEKTEGSTSKEKTDPTRKRRKGPSRDK